MNVAHPSSEDVRVATSRTRSPNDTKVSEYITQHGTDGIGHQLLGMYSCMLLPLLDDRWVYVKKEFIGTSGHRSSNNTRRLVDALQRGSQERPASADVRQVDNCFKSVQILCTKHPRECIRAKWTLTQRLAKNFADFTSTQRSLRSEHGSNLILHVRGGDREELLRLHWEKYPPLIRFISEQIDIRSLEILCEYESEAQVIRDELIPRVNEAAPHISVTVTSDGDPVASWSKMVHSKVLILGPSSFSVSAASLRVRPTFATERRPIGGRYDDNVLPCAVTLEELNSSTPVFFDLHHGTTQEECVENALLTSRLGYLSEGY